MELPHTLSNVSVLELIQVLERGMASVPDPPAGGHVARTLKGAWSVESALNGYSTT